jgi:hypothetical protein
MSIWMTWIQFFNFFLLHLYRYQNNTRRKSSIPQDKNKKLGLDFDKGQNLRKMIQ